MCSSSPLEKSELIALFRNAASSLALLLTMPETLIAAALSTFFTFVIYSGLNDSVHECVLARQVPQLLAECQTIDTQLGGPRRIVNRLFQNGVSG
jgi:hypothetical protein